MKDDEYPTPEAYNAVCFALEGHHLQWDKLANLLGLPATTRFPAIRLKVSELLERIKETKTALVAQKMRFENILRIQWGWEGDCGALAIARDGIEDIEAILEYWAKPPNPPHPRRKGEGKE